MGRTKEPWYSKGLQFECTNCGDCCTGETGYVWVTREEILLLSAHLRVELKEFQQKYVRSIDGHYSLRELSNGDCMLFDAGTRRCIAYSARPRQCRTWPFWEHNLRSSQAWGETCKVCPGSGTGRLYQLEEIEEHLQPKRP